jgi:eukaryotic-like serine/threonine-protein kinase
LLRNAGCDRREVRPIDLPFRAGVVWSSEGSSGGGAFLCSVCGAPLESSQSNRCPRCLLSAEAEPTAGVGNSQLGGPSLTVQSDLAVLRFDHFIVELDSQKKPMLLGRGAMGVTYQAFDTTLRRSVALKVIASHLIASEGLKNRFLKEARAAASLRHPHIASVFYLGSTEQSYFYAMELAAGQTLEHLIATDGPLSVDQALEITTQVASALAAAHEVGLVHRDIKPSNLVVSTNRQGRLNAKVIDFGLAKVNSEPSEDSEPGIFLGTPRYASPEQFAGEPVDIRSDIYSLGITLWQMVTNTLPFNGSPSEIAIQRLQSRLPIDQLRQCPQPLVDLLRQMLARDPRARPQTPEALLGLVEETQARLRPAQGAARVRPFGSRWKWPSRSRQWISIGAGAFLLLAVSGGLYLYLGPASSKIFEKSVAVLPFDNLGSDNQDEYLSDGLTNEIIFQLSKVSDLRVIARSSVLRYRAAAERKGLRQIGEELQVGSVLESSIERVGKRLKIVTILYDSRNDRRIWGASYDREIDDVFAIQTDLAENIAGALRGQLIADERKKLEKKPTQDGLAYQKYLQGQALYHLGHKEDNERAIDLFQQALGIDSGFALACVGLANAHIDRFDLYEQEESNVDVAVDYARRAIALDPAQARAYSTLARALNYKGLDEEAEKINDKALQLAPNDFEPNKRAAYLAQAVGRFDRLYELLRKCHSIDPADPYEPFTLGMTCLLAGDRGRAEHWFDVSIRIEHDAVRRRILEANWLIWRGKLAEADKTLRALPLEASAKGSNSVLQLLVASAARLGDWNTVSNLARKRYEQGRGSREFDKWSLAYLALWAKASDDQVALRQAAEQIRSLVLSQNQNSEISHWDAYYLAIGERYLGNKQEAYKYLSPIFRIAVLNLPLMINDPTLDVFRQDQEFSDLVRQSEEANAQLRGKISTIDRSY